MKRSAALICSLVLMAAFALQAAEPAQTRVTGKVVALRDVEGKLTAVKLLGKDGRIYAVALDEKGRQLAGEARQLVDVTGKAVEEKAEGDKPAVYRLTVEAFTIAEAPAADRGSPAR